ncbi:hypothetical protein KFL_006120065 [Klebsormidium nitens]|uniref:Uncharacterized protein n=1 Tax=Klebsormidium nitens TaxID=105231 RepID=A0A1Y1IHN2_KLENI|nr:hypothetical protein KFL_006120065 [Klebsormidium nitens]|eukprot:GAQ90203.1 hypothetical protein KFL_006120065 [Klebsormidium nitens]
MPSAPPSLEDLVILVRSLDENVAERTLLPESSAPAISVPVVVEGPKVAGAEKESDADEDDDAKRLPVSPELAESLLAVMQTVKEEGGADPEDAEEAEELAGRLSHVCEVSAYPKECPFKY